jgi:hypothetical protein
MSRTTPPRIKVGDRVDYHSIIGGPVTLRDAIVRAGPSWMSDHWSVWITGMVGSVCVDALTPAVEVSP